MTRTVNRSFYLSSDVAGRLDALIVRLNRDRLAVKRRRSSFVVEPRPAVDGHGLTSEDYARINAWIGTKLVGAALIDEASARRARKRFWVGKLIAEAVWSNRRAAARMSRNRLADLFLTVGMDKLDAVVSKGQGEDASIKSAGRKSRYAGKAA